MHLRTWVPFLVFWIVSISQVLRYFVRRYQQLSWVVGCLVLATNGLKFVWCLDSFHTMDLEYLDTKWIWILKDLETLGFGPYKLQFCNTKRGGEVDGCEIWETPWKNGSVDRYGPNIIIVSLKKNKRFFFFFFFLRYRFITEDEHLNKFIHCFPGIQMLIITDNMDLCFTVFSCCT